MSNRRILFQDYAVIIDPNEYQGQDWSHDFVTAAIEECYDFLPDDWEILNVSENKRVITVVRKKYEDGQNLQPFWIFNIKADPVDDVDNQWLVFDVMLDTAWKHYRFQLP